MWAPVAGYVLSDLLLALNVSHVLARLPLWRLACPLRPLKKMLMIPALPGTYPATPCFMGVGAAPSKTTQSWVPHPMCFPCYVWKADMYMCVLKGNICGSTCVAQHVWLQKKVCGSKETLRTWYGAWTQHGIFLHGSPKQSATNGLTG